MTQLVKIDELKQMVAEFLNLDDVLHESSAPLENNRETQLMVQRWNELRKQLKEVSNAD